MIAGHAQQLSHSMARHSVSTAISRLLCLAFLLPSLVTAISPISIKGTKLYDEDGKQFFVKGSSCQDLTPSGPLLTRFLGVAYAPESASYKDMLVNSDQCQIDAGLIKSLGANTIRVYSVDGTENHDDCMRAFANQGIYVWVELATAKHAISRVGDGLFCKAMVQALIILCCRRIPNGQWRCITTGPPRSTRSRDTTILLPSGSDQRL